MEIKPIQSNITFGYTNKLKTLFLKGKIKPKYGLYGDKLTKETVTLEHLKCVSQGGKTTLDNVVLSTASKNQERGIRPLKEVFSWENAGRYLEQFKDVVVGKFNGNEYIQGIIKTVTKLLQE